MKKVKKASAWIKLKDTRVEIKAYDDKNPQVILDDMIKLYKKIPSLKCKKAK